MNGTEARALALKGIELPVQAQVLVKADIFRRAITYREQLNDWRGGATTRPLLQDLRLNNACVATELRRDETRAETRRRNVPQMLTHCVETNNPPGRCRRR